jgi:molybdenum cofactor biosynthesis enzyme MoaA
VAINVNLELTDLCNIKCKMCGQAETPKVHGYQANKFMDWDTWRASIDALASYPDEVDLCPHWLGEPTLHPRFSEFVRYAFEQNAGNRLFRHWKLHTNGTLLGDERIETILDCANRDDQAADTFGFVHFSVDAYLPRVYRDIKRYDLGAQVYRNIRTLLARREERGLHWPHITVAFIVMPENRHESRWFLDYWGSLFAATGKPWEVVYDWPQRFADTIYFRRLHQADQPAADRIHREVLDDLGILAQGADGAFIEESF